MTCIFAELAQIEPASREAHVNVCLEHVRQAVTLWKLGGKKEPDKIKEIEKEKSFKSLKEHPEFIRLIADAKK
jgi:hypothetical protein